MYTSNCIPPETMKIENVCVETVASQWEVDERKKIEWPKREHGNPFERRIYSMDWLCLFRISHHFRFAAMHLNILCDQVSSVRFRISTIRTKVHLNTSSYVWSHRAVHIAYSYFKWMKKQFLLWISKKARAMCIFL